jgi:hypothetical protein
LSFVVSRTLAGELSSKFSAQAAFINAAFLKVLDRPPTAEEARASTAYLAKQAELYRDPAKLTLFTNGAEVTPKPSADPNQRARESLVHVLFNHNDFVTLR